MSNTYRQILITDARLSWFKCPNPFRKADRKMARRQSKRIKQQALRDYETYPPIEEE